jgi:hypothetical protein
MKTLTVGIAGADIIGSDSTAIQRAIDQLAATGGGTVKVLPGTYTCFDALRLRSNIRLIGDQESTRLVHGLIPASPLAIDADIGEKQITPVSTEGFKAGMGIVLRDRTKPNGMSTMPLFIDRVENGILYLNNWITHDWCAENDGCVVAYSPLIHAYEVENVVVDGFTLDGSVAAPPEELDGLWGGNLYFRRVQNVEIRNVTSHHAYGDGIRFGQSQNVIVEDCEVHHNTHYGVHPGSHSHPIRCSRLHIHHNGSDGLYICWGVQNSLFEDCDIHHNGWRIYRNGISVGHKDSGNLFIKNRVYENCKYGVAIRIKTDANGAHRNTFRDNLIENNGSHKDDIPLEILNRLPHPEEELTGCGVDIKGITHGLVFENNTIRETRAGDGCRQRIGVRIHPGVSDVRMENNTIEGHPDGNTVDLR